MTISQQGVMSRRLNGNTVSTVVLILGLSAWQLYSMYTNDTVPTSDAGLWDGLAHGLRLNLTGLQMTFGAELLIYDTFAGWTYGLGFGLGVGGILAIFHFLTSWWADQVILYGEKRWQRPLLLSVAFAIAAFVLAFFMADHPGPPPAVPDQPGGWWKWVGVIAADVLTLGLAAMGTTGGWAYWRRR
jgi:hypothetical protein